MASGAKPSAIKGSFHCVVDGGAGERPKACAARIVDDQRERSAVAEGEVLTEHLQPCRTALRKGSRHFAGDQRGFDGTAEIEVHNPRRPGPTGSSGLARWFDPGEFWRLFTEAERLGILDSTAPAVRLLHTDLQTARYVEPGHPDTEAGLDVLVAEALLTPARATRVRAFLPPEQ